MFPVRRNGAGRSPVNGVEQVASSSGFVDDASLLGLQCVSPVAGSRSLVSSASVRAASLHAEHEETPGVTSEAVVAPGDVLLGCVDEGPLVAWLVELPWGKLFEWPVEFESEGMVEVTPVVADVFGSSLGGPGVQ